MGTKRHETRRIENRWLLFTCATLVALSLCGCKAREPGMSRVGMLCGADFFLPVIDGFKARMTELGFKEGENIAYELRTYNADPAAEREAAEKFVREKVDLILAVPTEAAVAAQMAIRGSEIPLVFAYAGIEGADLVDSVRRPGRNTTGLRFPGPELISRRLELILQFVPGVKRVWIGYDKNYPNTRPTLDTLRPLASAKGVTLVEVPAAEIEDLKTDLAHRANQPDPGLDAIILMPDTFNHSPEGWGAIRAFAKQKGIPVCGSFLYTVEQGAIFGNANDLFMVGKLTAPLASKILGGMPAGEIPVVTPNQQLLINYRAARKMGLKVPDSLLRMATQIIR